jgi:hypothetical protein
MEPSEKFKADFTDSFHGAYTYRDLADQEKYRIFEPGSRPAADLAERINEIRQEIFEQVDNHVEGINTNRINDYFKKQGLPQCDYLLLDDTGIAGYNAISQANGLAVFPSPKEHSRHSGIYSSALKLAIVHREPTSEAQYGTMFSEANLVHELAHGSSTWNEWQLRQEPLGLVLDAKRTGHAVENDHSFLEEGFAAMITRDYLLYEAHVDRKYASQYLGVPGIAGDALNEMCHHEPKLYDALIEARSSAEGLRQVAKLCNQLKPGLYGELKDISYTQTGFTIGAGLVNDALRA